MIYKFLYIVTVAFGWLWVYLEINLVSNTGVNTFMLGPPEPETVVTIARCTSVIATAYHFECFICLGFSLKVLQILTTRLFRFRHGYLSYCLTLPATTAARNITCMWHNIRRITKNLLSASWTTCRHRVCRWCVLPRTAASGHISSSGQIAIRPRTSQRHVYIFLLIP